LNLLAAAPEAVNLLFKLSTLLAALSAAELNPSASFVLLVAKEPKN